MPDCCDYWPRIRPLLGWFEIDAPEPGTLVIPVIGPANVGATRVNFCPSCGASVRGATWSVAEMEAAFH